VRKDSISAEKVLYKNALKPAAQEPQNPAGAPAATPDPTAAVIMSHPLVRALAQSDAGGTITRLPSYLSSGVFTDSLLDSGASSTHCATQGRSLPSPGPSLASST
jgi:hypothetical protein